MGQTPRHRKQFAPYKGDECLCIGTIRQIAKIRNVQIDSVKFYLTPTYKMRVSKSKNPANRLALICVD